MLPTDLGETPPTQNSTADLEIPDLADEESSKKTAGRWTKEEHQRFVEGLKKFGKNWKRIEEYVGTRSGAQIRSHAQKFFIRLEKEFDLESKNQKGVSGGKDVPAPIRKASACSNSTTCSYQGKLKSIDQLTLAQETPIESIKPLESLISNRSNLILPTFPKTTEPDTPICLAPVVNNFSFAMNNLTLNQILALNSLQQKQRRMSVDVFPPTFPTTPLFDAFTSNLKPSDNTLALSRLSELMSLTPTVGLVSNIQPYLPNLGLNQIFPFNSTIPTHNFDHHMFPMRTNPRKFSEDNVLVQSRQESLQRFNTNNRSEFELLSKKMKKL